MFCWGNSTHHELCIEANENTDLVSIHIHTLHIMFYIHTIVKQKHDKKVHT